MYKIILTREDCRNYMSVFSNIISKECSIISERQTADKFVFRAGEYVARIYVFPLYRLVEKLRVRTKGDISRKIADDRLTMRIVNPGGYNIDILEKVIPLHSLSDEACEKLIALMPSNPKRAHPLRRYMENPNDLGLALRQDGKVYFVYFDLALDYNISLERLKTDVGTSILPGIPVGSVADIIPEIGRLHSTFNPEEIQKKLEMYNHLRLKTLGIDWLASSSLSTSIFPGCLVGVRGVFTESKAGSTSVIKATNMIDVFKSTNSRTSVASSLDLEGKSRFPGEAKEGLAAIRLSGGGLSPEENKQVNQGISGQITRGEATTLFVAQPARLEGDIDLRKDTGRNAFMRALRDQQNIFSPEFDVVLVDEDLPLDIILHPGHRRNQVYMPGHYLRMLSDIYDRLDLNDQPEMLAILGEAFQHEDEHLRQYRSTLGAHGPPLESAIDRIAPSFRARALFRMLYAFRKTSAQPDFHEFFNRLRLSKREFSSYLHGYLHLNYKEHLTMAMIFIKGKPSTIDVILAQYHLGSIFNHTAIDAPLFKEAIKVMEEHKVALIDINPETNKQFSVWHFIRELVRQNRLIEYSEPVARLNIKATSLDQLEPWTRGTSEKSGDSILYPLPDATTALPVSLAVAKDRLEAMGKLSLKARDGIINRLRTNANGDTLFSYEDLKTIGGSLLTQTGYSATGAGKGTRYARITYDKDGNRKVEDQAKGVYFIPIDGNRTILEVTIAQIRAMNVEYGTNIPFDLYISFFTHEDLRQELNRLGYHEGLLSWLFQRGIYTHPALGSPPVRLLKTRKTHLFDLQSGDFYKRIDPLLPWTEVFWPDGHDTTLVDLVVSGRAYELLESGMRYQVISNIDNRAGIPDPIVLAIMRLTAVPLIAEVGLKPKGNLKDLVKLGFGGSLIKFKVDKLPEAINFGNDRGLLEGMEFDEELIRNLTNVETTARYLGLFNTANYTVDIIGFARALLGMSETTPEALIKDTLKKFYDARVNPEQVVELRYQLLERFRQKTQLWETDKRYPALVPANLAGTLTWLVPTLFLEVPIGEEAGSLTRFEPLKDNIENWILIRDFVDLLLRQENNSDTTPVDKAMLSKSLLKKMKFSFYI